MTDDRRSRWTNVWRREAVCLVAFVALAAVVTYPLVFDIRHAIPGGNDAWVYYWDLWWIERALIDLHANPFFTPDLYYPYGAPLYFHALNFLPSILGLPVALVFGLTAAYNVVTFLSFTLSGYGMYRLVLYVLRHENDPDGAATQPRIARFAAFIGGLTFAFSTYRIVHTLGHLDLASTEWMPFFVLFLLKTRDEEGWMNPVLCALFLAATALTALYYAVFLALLTALFAPTFVALPVRDRAAALTRAAVAAIVFVAIMAPLLVPMLRLGATFVRVSNPAYDVDRFSADLLAFVVPSPLHPMLGGFVEPVNRQIVRAISGLETVTFLGYTPLVLACLGLARSRATRGFWLAVFCVFTLLALGPVAHVAGRPILPTWSAFMPYSWISRLPYGDILRVPARFVLMTTMALGVLAAVGVRTVLRGVSDATAFGLTVLLGALILAEHLVVPLPLSIVESPPYFARLAQEPDRAGVLEVPIPDDPATYPRRMFYQTVHGKPIYGGYLSRGLPPLQFDAIPGFSQLKTLTDRLDDDVVAYERERLPAISRAVLDVYDAGHLVIDKTVMSALDVERARHVADGLVGSSSLVDEDRFTLAYAIPRPAAPPPLAVWLDTGWSYRERLDQTDASGRATVWRWMGERARLGVIVAEPRTVSLRMVGQAFRRARRLRVSVAGSDIGTLVMATERDQYETPPFRVPAGGGFVELESLDGAESPGADRRKLSVAMFHIELVGS